MVNIHWENSNLVFLENLNVGLSYVITTVQYFWILLSYWLSLSFGLHVQIKKYAMARNIERRALGIRDWRKSDESSQPPLDDIIQILSKYGKVCKFASSRNLNIYWVRFKYDRSTEDNFVDKFGDNLGDKSLTTSFT